MQFLVVLFGVALLIVIFLAVMKVVLVVGGITLAAWILLRVGRYVLKERYFASEKFLAHKNKVAAVVAEHNDIADYVSEIHSQGSFSLGASATGTHAHLATFQNTSQHKYRRDRNVANYEAPNVHNCSLQVVRNAKAAPVKYVMKYFKVKAGTLSLSARLRRTGTRIPAHLCHRTGQCRHQRVHPYEASGARVDGYFPAHVDGAGTQNRDAAAQNPLYGLIAQSRQP